MSTVRYEPTARNHSKEFRFQGPRSPNAAVNILLDPLNNVQMLVGTTAQIPSGVKGYAVSCAYFNSTTGQILTNIGTTTSCNFVPGVYLSDQATSGPNVGKTYYLQITNGNLQTVEVV